MAGPKKEKISKLDSDGELIYQPPHKDTLYTIDELESLLSDLAGYEVPEDKRNPVQTSHWIKRKALELLGYNDPEGFRTKVAKRHKPKFIHQVMDLFAQSRDNLQIWGYIPYTDAEIEAAWRYDRTFEFSETRIVIVRHEDYIIRGVRIVEAEELASWDATGTETFKWQGFIPNSFRQAITLETGDNDPIFDTLGIQQDELDSLEERIETIKQKESATSTSLAVEKPDPSLLLTVEEIGQRLQPLVGERIQDEGERVTGQLFEKEVAKRFGYAFTDTELSADTGSFPDIRHQFIETKFQDSPTIDLGRHHPDNEDVLESDWSEGLAPRDARYVVGLADEVADGYEITGITVVSGDEFSEYFSITEGTNSKVQMTIPDFESIGDDDVEVKSESDE
jgi:hypothetical protein